MKIKIKNLKLHFSYKYQFKNECNYEQVCGICHLDYENFCGDIKCLKPNQCPTIVGKCSHAFHFHCIGQWLDVNSICPVCRRTWVVDKEYK